MNFPSKIIELPGKIIYINVVFLNSTINSKIIAFEPKPTYNAYDVQF